MNPCEEALLVPQAITAWNGLQGRFIEGRHLGWERCCPVGKKCHGRERGWATLTERASNFQFGDFKKEYSFKSGDKQPKIDITRPHESRGGMKRDNTLTCLWNH